MVAFLHQSYTPILIVGAVLAVVLFTICVIKKFVRLAIGIAILSVLIPALFTIFWGDGSSYISEIASYLTPNHQHQLEEAYAYYKERDAENQIIDYEAVSDKITDVFTAIQDSEKEAAQMTADYVTEKAEEWLKQSPIFPSDKKTDSGP